MNVKPLAMVGVAGVALLTLTACPSNSSSTGSSASPSTSTSAASASASTNCPLTVSDAFVKTAQSGSTEAIGTVKNTGTETIKITGASSPAATATELRRYVDQNGSATTEPVTDWAVSAGSSIQLTYNFLLLVDLKYPITADQEVPITLKCQAGDQTGLSLGMQMTFSARGRDDLDSGGGYTPQQSTSPSYSMSPSWSGSPSPSWSPTTTSPTSTSPTTSVPTTAPPTLQAPPLSIAP